jgi:hypothetical protein
MNGARERMLDSPIYSDAAKPLIGKLLVPENFTSTERKECLAEMTTKFFDEHQKVCEPDRHSEQWHNVVCSREE